MDRMLLERPIFFERNRVYRVYLGGKGFESLYGAGEEDGCFPEEWIASAVKAINPKYFGERDGVSVVRGSGIYFDDLLNNYPEELLGGKPFGCLVKFLDSAIRLPVQVHPTREFAKRHFQSPYGKAEAWLILATRENARIYFGFRDRITKEQLAALERESEENRDVMAGVLQSVSVKPGDVFFIRAGLVHAIGAGCTLIEIQEPTDFTIQPESWCGEYHISSEERYLGLGQDTALECFDLGLYGEKAVAAAKLSPKVEAERQGYRKELLVGADVTPCFSLYRHILTGGEICLDKAPAVYVLLDGAGILYGDGYRQEVAKGEYFFLPKIAAGKFMVKGDCVLAECCSGE